MTTPPDIDQHLERIEAKILATQAAFRVLLMAHPEREMVARAVQSEIERVFSSALQKPLSDAYVEAFAASTKILIPRNLRQDG